MEDEIKVGDKFIRNADNRVLKIMAIVDNWCMVRYSGCTPFTIHKKDLLQHVSLLKFTPKNTTTKTDKDGD